MELGHLVPYELETCPTGTRWSPQRLRQHGDFTPASLRKLATSRVRNNLIVNEYCNNADRYGKTVIFACDIPHANKLVSLLGDRGILVSAIHSQMAARDREEAFDEFTAEPPRLKVLVNVEQLTHGVDIPSIQTVFLCRPYR